MQKCPKTMSVKGQSHQKCGPDRHIGTLVELNIGTMCAYLAPIYGDTVPIKMLFRLTCSQSLRIPVYIPEWQICGNSPRKRIPGISSPDRRNPRWKSKRLARQMVFFFTSDRSPRLGQTYMLKRTR